MVLYQLTEDEFEFHFGVNYLGHFLLTQLLLHQIKVINVSALGHVAGRVDFNDMMWEMATINLKHIAAAN